MNFSFKSRKEAIPLGIVFLAVLVISAFAVYFIAGRQAAPDTSRQEPQTGASVQQPSSTERRSADISANDNFLDRLFGLHQNEARQR